MDIKRAKRRNPGTRRDARAGLPLSFCVSNILVRVHDEATTSDDDGDTGNQFNIAAGANDYGKKANHDQKDQEGACRNSYRTPDQGTARTDAKPAVSDRLPQTRER